MKLIILNVDGHKKTGFRFVRKQNKESPRPDQLSCSFFEKLEERPIETIIPRKIFNLEDLKDFGQDEGICPYFAAR